MMKKRCNYILIVLSATIMLTSSCARRGPNLLLKYYEDSGSLSIKKLERGREPSWSPDGEKIIYTHEQRIYIYNVITEKIQSLPCNGKNPCWSPDGKYILYSHNGIRKYSFDINKEGLLSPFGDHPLWSPQGDTIIFSHEGAIWRMDTKGEGRELFIDKGIPRSISSDSSSLLIEQWDEKSLQFNLALVEMNTRRITPLWTGYQGSFSPDDRIVVYSANGIFLYERKLKKKINIISSGFSPSWSPDGDKIIFCDMGYLWLVDSLSTFPFF